MSIILEALKKASNKTEIGPVHGSSPGPEASAISALEAHDFRFSGSMLMMVSALVIIAAVAYFTGIQKHDSGTSSPLHAVNSGVEKAAEGYTPSASPSAVVQESTPISNLMTKLSNPRLTLNGIVYGIGKPAAIIENKII
jgi:hypothetical protein